MPVGCRVLSGLLPVLTWRGRLPPGQWPWQQGWHRILPWKLPDLGWSASLPAGRPDLEERERGGIFDTQMITMRPKRLSNTHTNRHADLQRGDDICCQYLVILWGWFVLSSNEVFNLSEGEHYLAGPREVFVVLSFPWGLSAGAGFGSLSFLDGSDCQLPEPIRIFSSRRYK